MAIAKRAPYRFPRELLPNLVDSTALSPLRGNDTLAELGLEKHPDKTFIGRAAKGFDFLGDRLSPTRLTVAKQTWQW